jgi:GNAT superfamily N-acetyltransferase
MAVEEMLLRAARPDEAEALSGLALRSKAHWGYNEEFLAACRDELHLRPQEIVSHRVVVAERDHRTVGFASLVGEPPDGELTMLFVEPAAIRSGVGRRLYEHVFKEAGTLGFARVTIEADPHAEGFYLAMGADLLGNGRSLSSLVAWPHLPEPSWVAAWTGGGPAVHVGNVAEFNAQFGRPFTAPDHYSCLAVFGSPRPAIVVLPEKVDESWIEGLSAVLDWGDVEVHSGIAYENGRLSIDAELREHLRSADLPVLPWGRTADFERLAPTPDGVRHAITRFESKAGAHALFDTLAPGHPNITVPAQRPAGSRRALARELAAGPRVLKSEYGVGGSGTLVVTAPLTRPLIRRWARDDVLVEEYVAGSGPFRNPTFDAVIDAAGEVHPVGVGLMDVDGTSYRGVTVGPGVLPDPLARTATNFGTAVGLALAAEGYRGWYDVDFVTDHADRLAPTEINLRLTGPAVAFNLQARLDRLRGGRHFVRTLDQLPLGARLPARALREHLERLAEDCGATLLTTIPSAAFDPVPYLGVAIAARSARTLDEAERIIRSANKALGKMFTDLDDAPRRSSAWRPGGRRPRPRRSSG